MIGKIRDLFRPICPHCDGKGGFMSGYYEPEFSGCSCCNEDEQREEDVVRVWRWQWWLHQYRMWQEERYWSRICDRDANT